MFTFFHVLSLHAADNVQGQSNELDKRIQELYRVIMLPFSAQNRSQVGGPEQLPVMLMCSPQELDGLLTYLPQQIYCKEQEIADLRQQLAILWVYCDTLEQIREQGRTQELLQSMRRSNQELEGKVQDLKKIKAQQKQTLRNQHELIYELQCRNKDLESSNEALQREMQNLKVFAANLEGRWRNPHAIDLAAVNFAQPGVGSSIQGSDNVGRLSGHPSICHSSSTKSTRDPVITGRQ